MTVAEDPVAVHVPLGARAYEVRIGAGLIRRAGAEIAPLLIVIKLEEFDYAGATAVATAMLMLSLIALLAINALQAWTHRRHGARA